MKTVDTLIGLVSTCYTLDLSARRFSEVRAEVLKSAKAHALMKDHHFDQSLLAF